MPVSEEDFLHLSNTVGQLQADVSVLQDDLTSSQNTVAELQNSISQLQQEVLDLQQGEGGLTAQQVQDMINESMPGWGLDGLWWVFTYASWWWLLECPSESPGPEIAAGTPFWRNVIMGPQEPQGVANALGCQRVIKRRSVMIDGKPGWESHELNRQEDGTWI